MFRDFEVIFRNVVLNRKSAFIASCKTYNPLYVYLDFLWQCWNNTNIKWTVTAFENVIWNSPCRVKSTTVWASPPYWCSCKKKEGSDLKVPVMSILGQSKIMWIFFFFYNVKIHIDFFSFLFLIVCQTEQLTWKPRPECLCWLQLLFQSKPLP